jgi:hypothetical protein
MVNIYRVRVAGRTFTGAYLSGGLAVILAQCFHARTAHQPSGCSHEQAAH